MNNVTVFCTCLKNLPMAKEKSFRLIPLAQEISKEPNIDSALWLLVVILMEIHNEKEKDEQEKLYNVKFKDKNTL